MGRVLALQHVWENPVGRLGNLLHEHGIEYDTVDVETQNLPDPSAYHAVIAFGGSQHLYAEDQYPYFAQEQELIRTVLEKEIPFLGICLGSQLLAKVLGGVVKKHTMTEIGFFDVEFTDAGKKDPLYAGLPGHQKIYHWHADTFTLPTGASLLATNENTVNQAFRYGKRAYGIQYHVELDSDMLYHWLHHPDAKESVIKEIGEEGHGAIVAGEPLHYPIYLSHTRVMFENFLRISELI